VSMHSFQTNLRGSGRSRAGGLGGAVLDIGRTVIPGIIEEILGTGDRDLSELPGLPTMTNGPGPTFKVGACGVGGRTQAAIINGQPCCPTGFHFSQKSGCCIKNRRMNVLNMRAHGRATRRIKGTARALQKAKAAVRDAAIAMDACPKPSRRRRAPCK